MRAAMLTAAADEARFATCTRLSRGMASIRSLLEQLRHEYDLPSKTSRTRTSRSTPHWHRQSNLLLVVVRKSPSGVHKVLARAAGSLDAVASLHRIS